MSVWRDRVLPRLSEALETSTGLTVVDNDEYSELLTENAAYADLATEAEDLAFWALQGQAGLSSDARPEKRARIAKRARMAWASDPLAGTEAEHYANFALGRGVSAPKAKDEEVQRILDQGWLDNPKLTSLDGLRAISNELRSAANVYVLFFRNHGKVRTSFLVTDDVHTIRPSDEDRLTPLWYVAKHVERKWSYEHHGFTTVEADADPKKGYRYYAHYLNVEEDQKREDGKKTEMPSKDMQGEGVVYHVRINRPLEGHFGVPPWQRTIKFFSALNRLIEARVSMQLAASSIIAKRVVRGGQSDVLKAAQNVVNQLGEIGAASTRRPDAKTPPRPGRTDVENDADRLESVNLNSGAANAQTDLNVIRGAAIAPSCFGQHWYGAADQTSLASAATAELPAAAALGAYQEVIEQLLRTFSDILIEEAVRNGDLGGTIRGEGDSALTELRLVESEAGVREAERRTKKDLSYTFEMPYPGRRNLPDITGGFTTMMSIASQGENEPLTKLAYQLLLTHGYQMENASEEADAIATEQKKLLKDAQAQAQAQAVPPPPLPGDGATTTPPPAADQVPVDQQSQYGEKRKASAAKGEMGTSYESLGEAEFLGANQDEVDKLLVAVENVMARRATKLLSANGDRASAA